MRNFTEVSDSQEDGEDEDPFVNCPFCNAKWYWDGTDSDCEHLIFGTYCQEFSHFEHQDICDLLEEVSSEISEHCEDSGRFYTIFQDLSEYFKTEELPSGHLIDYVLYFSDRKDLADVIIQYKICRINELREEL